MFNYCRLSRAPQQSLYAPDFISACWFYRVRASYPPSCLHASLSLGVPYLNLKVGLAELHHCRLSHILNHGQSLTLWPRRFWQVQKKHPIVVHCGAERFLLFELEYHHWYCEWLLMSKSFHFLDSLNAPPSKKHHCSRQLFALLNCSLNSNRHLT